MLHLIVNLLGDQDAARLGHGLKARGEVDARTQQIVAVDHHIAEMDADPEVQRGFRGRVGITKFALHLDRALDGFDDRGELRNQPVARRVGDAAVVTFNKLGESAPRGVQGAKRAHLVNFHFTAVARCVGREDRRQFSSHIGGHGGTRISGKAKRR